MKNDFLLTSDYPGENTVVAVMPRTGQGINLCTRGTIVLSEGKADQIVTRPLYDLGYECW